MRLPQRISDPEIEACASEIATDVLEHPLARRLNCHTIWVLTALAAGDPGIRPADGRPVLRLAMAAIDAAEIAVGLEVLP
jgi:hypothetical protein